MTPKRTLEAYAKLYEMLTPETVGDVRLLCNPQVRFRDPFNDVVGVDRYVEILSHMFRDVDEPKFSVEDVALTEKAGYLRWVFTFRLRGREWTIPGMSEIHFDDRALIAAHIDHWDSGAYFYARLPVIGWLIERVRRRIALSD